MVTGLGSLVAAFWAMLHLRTLLLGAVVFLFLADFLKSRRPKHYPPGPWRLPFVGHLLHLDFSKVELKLPQYVKKYGNLLRLDLGFISSVVITGLPLIKEVCGHMEQHFVNRPITAHRKRTFKNYGLIMSNGQIWKEQRRFTLATLRNFGLGKKSVEYRIQEEAQHLTETIENKKGQPFDPHFIINNAVSNIICSIAFGERYDYQDDEFQELLKTMDEIMCLEASLHCQLYDIFPWIMKFLPGQHQTLFSNWKKMKLFVSRVIEKHKNDWNPAEPRDLIDAYLNEMAKHTDKNTSSFHEENLICCTLDLFSAGTETTSMILRWGLLFVTFYQEVQEKVQAEIDEVVGQWRQPSLTDRESMPYTNAVIHEVLRMGNIFLLGAPREVTVDTTLAGYQLPRGTIIFPNMIALHRDPKEWATPDTFNPEHFLENGQFRKRESFLPFGMGKRACLGEQLAKSELFIFFTSLLQKFTFKPPPNVKLSLKARMSIPHSPPHYHICAVQRA